MRSWISRSFKNALVRRLVCDGALSSCHHQLDVSVPRRAMRCGKYTSSSTRTWHSVLMRMPSSMKHGGENDAVHHRGAQRGAWGLRWLCSLMYMSGSRSVFRAGLPWLQPPKCGCSAREHHTVCHGPSTPSPCSTSRQKFNLAKRFSAVNRGARTGLKHRAWRSSCRARHHVERDMSSELCRRSTLRVCRGVSVTAVSISARTSLVRRRFSRRDSSDVPRRRPVWRSSSHWRS